MPLEEIPLSEYRRWLESLPRPGAEAAKLEARKSLRLA